MNLNHYLANVEETELTDARKTALTTLVNYVAACLQKGQPVQLNFICTHNSRRSHLAQVWAQVWAQQSGVENAHFFSGGTEATAFNPRAVAALQRAGLHIEKEDGNESNPRYHVHMPLGGELVCYSKRYDDAANPSANFAAVMTCTEADAACPAVAGATARISLPYRDPKEADDTTEETQRYDERCLQIASEMAYMFRRATSY